MTVHRNPASFYGLLILRYAIYLWVATVPPWARISVYTLACQIQVAARITCFFSGSRFLRGVLRAVQCPRSCEQFRQ